MTAEQLVQSGYCDPIRVFVKNEPHSEAKLSEGRYRLIMSVSLVDQLVERILCSEQNSLEIAQFEHLPVKPGMGFSSDKVHAIGDYLEEFEAKVSSDVSGWDWSVSGAELMFDAKRRIRAAGVPMDHPYASCLVNRAICLSRSVISFSDGFMVAQRFDGLQKSGSYNTSSGNSWIRVAAAVYCGASRVAAMGDDCVDSGFDALMMRDIGHSVKSAEVVSSASPSWRELCSMWPGELQKEVRELLESSCWKFFDSALAPYADFCSHFWCRLGGDHVVVYSGWRKSLFRLMNQRVDKREHFLEFVAMMSYNPAMPYCVHVLMSCDWFPTPDRSCLV
jgi:hypothetical protein